VWIKKKGYLNSLDERLQDLVYIFLSTIDFPLPSSQRQRKKLLTLRALRLEQSPVQREKPGGEINLYKIRYRINELEHLATL